MTEATRQRLFDHQQALADEVTVWLTLGITAALALSGGLIFALRIASKTKDSTRRELVRRWVSWLVIVPALLVPVLAGAAWTILMATILCLACYYEFARSTPLAAERLINATVVLGILALTFATLDHWYGLYVALFPLVTGLIAALAILRDRPQGYIQRVALGVLGFSIFGVALSHLGYMANDRDYRPLVMMLFVAVELNDIFAYVCGKSFGHRRLAPNTSPNKTLGGSLGALVLTTVVVFIIGRFVFTGTPLAQPAHLLTLGILISLLGQLGDLMLSSIKRDLNVKDMSAAIPGHGGLLDRFDSMILVAPAVFHYVGYFLGFGLDEQTRIFSGG